MVNLETTTTNLFEFRQLLVGDFLVLQLEAFKIESVDFLLLVRFRSSDGMRLVRTR